MSKNRTTSLKIAVATNMVSKIFGLATQLIVMPLAAGNLGVERYGQYAMLLSLFAWCGAFAAACGSSLTLSFVSNRNSVATKTDPEALKNSIAAMLVIGIAFCIFLIFLIHAVPPEVFFGSKYSENAESVKLSWVFLALAVPFNMIFTAFEAYQAASQKIYLLNAFSAAANIATLTLLFFEIDELDILSLVIFVNLPILLIRGINSIVATWGIKSSDFLSAKVDLIKALKSLSSSGWLVILQLSSLAFLQFPVWFAGRFVGLDTASTMYAMMQVISISGSFVLIISQPLMPAVADAFIKSDSSWLYKSYRNVFVLSAIYAFFASFLIFFFGNDVLTILLRQHVYIEYKTRFLWALIFIIFAVEHIGYVFLTGMGKLKKATLLYSISAFCVLVIIISDFNDATLVSILFAMCISPLIFTVFTYPIMTRKVIREIDVKL